MATPRLPLLACGVAGLGLDLELGRHRPLEIVLENDAAVRDMYLP